LSGAANQATHAKARVVVQVAVGVLVRSDGAVLLADRPPGKPYAGYWEFPGGKIEPGESVDQALRRELQEELGVVIGPSFPWTVMEYDYPHAYVRLHFRRTFEWQGTPHPVEGQRLLFFLPGQVPPQPLLPAAVPALRWAALPTSILRSAGTATSASQSLDWVRAVLERGARRILWHEPNIAEAERDAAASECRVLAREYGADVFVDSRSTRLAHLPCYLSAHALRALRTKPDSAAIAAGIHTARDIEIANRLGCEFTVLEGEPGEDGAVFEKLTELAVDAGQPVYVPLTPSPGNLLRAMHAGAHGLVMSLND
jgi:8-oxo-dGTP diphosphatase